jgi:PAS domain S-box-containing protein
MAATQEELKRAKDEIERRHQALADQRSLLGHVIDNMNNTVVAIDRNYNLLFVNEIVRKNYEVMGITIEPGMPIFELLPPGQREFYENAYNRALAGETFNVLNFFQMNGLEFRFSIDYYPLRDSSGEIVGAVASAIDLNQRQEIDMDASLRLDAIERSLYLLGAVSLGFDEDLKLYAIDKGGSWKSTAQRLLELVAHPDQDRLIKSVQAVANGQAILLQNVELSKTPGSDIHLWLVPNRGDSGIPGAVGVMLTLGVEKSAWQSLANLIATSSN